MRTQARGAFSLRQVLLASEQAAGGSGQGVWLVAAPPARAVLRNVLNACTERIYGAYALPLA